MNPDKSAVLSEFYLQQFAIRGKIWDQNMGSKERPAPGSSASMQRAPAAQEGGNGQHLTKLLVGRSDKLEIVTPPKFGVIVTAYNSGR